MTGDLTPGDREDPCPELLLVTLERSDRTGHSDPHIGREVVGDPRFTGPQVADQRRLEPREEFAARRGVAGHDPGEERTERGIRSAVGSITQCESLIFRCDGVLEPDDETWLCPSGFDRQRLVEATMSGQHMRRVMMLLLLILSLCLVPVVGWPPFIAIMLGAAVGEASEFGVSRANRPEYRIFGGWLGMLAVTALLVVLYDSNSLALMPIFIAMLMPLLGGYPVRVLAFGAAIVMMFELGVGFFLIRPLTPQVTLTTLATVAVTAVIAIGVVTLIRSDEIYRQKSVIDPLTGLLNRRSLESRVDELVAKADFRSLSMAVLMFDLDHFKAINDTYGHDVGDQVLRRSSDAMQLHLRSSDAIFRIGGEEFLAVLLDVDDEMAFQLAEGVRKGVEQSGGEPPVTVSAGIATHPGSDHHVFTELFRLADLALLEAKGSGRNRVRVSGGLPPVDGEAQRRIA